MIDEVYPNFDVLWRNALSFLPGTPMNWKDAEPFRKYAESVFNHLVDNEYVQKSVLQAYSNGDLDGANETKINVKNLIDECDMKDMTKDEMVHYLKEEIKRL